MRSRTWWLGLVLGTGCVRVGFGLDYAPGADDSRHEVQIPDGVFVAPAGDGSATGSYDAPLDLPTALTQPPQVTPGTTIWLREGVYPGPLVATLNGAPGQPIAIRPFPGEHVTLDGYPGEDVAVLSITNSSYVEVYDLEVTHSGTNRAPSVDRPYGITVRSADNVRLVHNVVHDIPFGGIYVPEDATNVELYGNVVYYNGTNSNGHGINAANLTTPKLFYDNVVFHNFAYGMHLFDGVDYVTVEGNIGFSNGSLAGTSNSNLLLGGGSVAQQPVFRANYMYYAPADVNGFAANLGYCGFGPGCDQAVVEDGYYVSGDTSFCLYQCTNVTMTGNTFVGPTSSFVTTDYPSNTYYATPPVTNPAPFVRPSVETPGRAHIVVFNWTLASTVAVDVSNVLSPGDDFEVRNAQNYYGPPVLQDTYNGQDLTLPLTGLASAQPVNAAFTAQSTGAQFNAFVLLKR
jgi:hypothetical protein